MIHSSPQDKIFPLPTTFRDEHGLAGYRIRGDDGGAGWSIDSPAHEGADVIHVEGQRGEAPRLRGERQRRRIGPC